MRTLRFAAALLLLAGCLEGTDRQRRTAGTGGGLEPEPDAALETGGAGGETGGAGGTSTGGVGTGGMGTGGSAGRGGTGGTGGTRRDAATEDGPASDAAAAQDTRAPDARPDAARDQASAAPDGPAPDAPTGGDPEPGRLAGITRFHNEVRAKIPVPGLTWDPSIAATAAAVAAKCMFDHSGTKGLGENLAAYAPPGAQKASAPVDDWAGEAADYNYASNSCAAGQTCGHYTQLVWKSSQKLGCAVQTCSTNSPFGDKFPNWDLWVCEYSPPGNFVGQRPY